MKKTIILTGVLIILLSSFSFAALTDDLRSSWSFEETGTVIKDNVNQSNNGTAVNTPAVVTGKFGNARKFVASSTQYISFANDDYWDLPAGAYFTWNLWVNRSLDSDSADANSLICGEKSGANYQGMCLQHSKQGGGTNGKTRFYYYDGATYDINPGWTGTRVDNGQWQMITYVYNQTHLMHYINGTLVNTSTVDATNIDNNGAQFSIGSRDHGIQFADMSMDEIGYWNRSLSATEINQLWNGGIGLSYPFVSAAVVTEVTSISPSNNTYHYSLPIFSGTCSFSPTANVTLRVNNTDCGTNTSISSGVTFTITPTCSPNFFTEQYWNFNCKGTDGVNNLTNAVRYFYYANSSGCTGTGGTTTYTLPLCYSAIPNGFTYIKSPTADCIIIQKN